jgi:hypothetical protein
MSCSPQIEFFYSSEPHSASRKVGFHKQHSVLSKTARITNFITHGFNLTKHTGLVLLDIEKACDTLWLNGLLPKLISLHLPHYLLFSLKSYLEGCTFTVHLNDSTSTPIPTPSSFPQGAVLLTTSFSLYFSDIACPLHTHLTLYADNNSRLS